MNADPRPDWTDESRGQCETCRSWRKLTKVGVLVKHKRQEPSRWLMVPCAGSGMPPAGEQAKLSFAKTRYAEALAKGWTVVVMHDGNWSIEDVKRFIDSAEGNAS